jgi:hypothetical protein
MNVPGGDDWRKHAVGSSSRGPLVVMGIGIYLNVMAVLRKSRLIWKKRKSSVSSIGVWWKNN